MKILVLLSRVPYPLVKGDKLRAFNQIKILAQKHEVILCALNDQAYNQEAVKQLKPYCSEIHIIQLGKASIASSLAKTLFSDTPFQVGYFYNKSIQRQVDEIIEYHQPDHIYCQLTRMTEYVRHIKDIPKTLDFQDAFAKGIERRVDGSPAHMKFILNEEHKRLRQYERKVFDDFENKTIISEQDRDLIDHPDKEEIVVVPNGVDFEFFKPMDSKKKFHLLFTGNMAYPPNVDSVVYLAKEVLPLVKEKYPYIRLLIAGASPAAKVRELKSSNIYVSGWVEDIRESYAQSKVFIAPMQIGTGLQNKLLEAMSMKLPCITSELANNALGAASSKEILIGKKPADYAQHIIYLLENPQAANQLAENGHRFVKQNYSWRAMTAPLLELIEEKQTVST